jgi:hypothetical protein
MPITVVCPRCEEGVAVQDDHAGKSIPCPKCKEAISVPCSAPNSAVDAKAREDIVAGLPVPVCGESAEAPLPEAAPGTARKPWTRKRKVGVFILVGFVILVAAGVQMYRTETATKKESLDYYAKMNLMFGHLGRSRGRCLSMVKSYFAADKVDPKHPKFAIGPIADASALRMAFRDVQTARDIIRAELATMHVPESARNLHEATQRALAADDESIRKLGEVVKIIEDEKLSDKQKTERGAQILKEIDSAEQPHRAELQRLHAEFAESLGLDVVSRAPK